MRHKQHFVEELTQREEQPVGRMLPISSVAPDPHQPRSSMGKLDDLVSSIRSKGILEPILVRPAESAPSLFPEDAKKFLIISGERRYRAALEAGLFEIPAIEFDVAPEEALEIALIENLQRKDLTPFEEAEGYQALINAHGYVHEKIAEAVGKSRVVITETLSLLKMPPRAREAVNALGISSRSVLLEVMKVKDEDEMIQLLEKVANQGLSREDLRRRKPKTLKGKRRKPYVFNFRAPDKSFNLSLKFRRSTVEKTDLIQALEEILSQLKESPEP